MQLIHHQPFALDIPDLGLRDVKPGEPFEATGEVAKSLIAQGFERTDAPTPKES